MFNMHLLATENNELSNLRNKISLNYRIDESLCIQHLLNHYNNDTDDNAKELAKELINKIRQNNSENKGINQIMQEYKLSTNEGVALMCLAESLLRIPDNRTKINLINDKITKGKWDEHLNSEQTFVNAASWGLLIAGKILNFEKNELSQIAKNITATFGNPIIRKAVEFGVKFMGNQFVMAENIETGIKLSKKPSKNKYKYSFDMLGEAAMTEKDALKYLQNYIDAINKVGLDAANLGIHKSNGISVKLSAIYSRYSRSKYEDVMSILYPRLKTLFLLAKKYQIGLFIDAEESERLDLSIDLFTKIAMDSELKDFKGLGFVVQSYQKRAFYVIEYLIKLANLQNNRFLIRLVKGAYWDSEIKKAQVDGQIDYPVFTRKFYTDLNYLVCAKKLFEHQAEIYPLFATHNAYTLATIHEFGKNKEYEFQCLYGMGETLYNEVLNKFGNKITCRIYAPIGTYETLLAYLVRRLLENGANSSFIYQLVDKNIKVEELIINPFEIVKKTHGLSNPYIPKPLNIFPDKRINSKGLDLTNEIFLNNFEKNLNELVFNKYNCHSLIFNSTQKYDFAIPVISPQDKNDIIGHVAFANENEVTQAITNAVNARTNFAKIPPKERAKIINDFANLLEDNYTLLISIIVREAGKTINNAINEIREAVDFCRYYAKIVETDFNNTNIPLGTLICISPWNFPLAIFIGEVVSSLLAGNTVIAKPAEQTSIIAYVAISLLHEAGIPKDALQLVLGDGIVGNLLTKNSNINGVIFTGSTEVARLINRNLANNPTNPVIIAETGGQNVMIVDSTALPEQVITDVITSAFDSAGQRCSALRVLYLQEEIYDKFVEMLIGAMQEFKIGNPLDIAVDVGPIIDKEAQTKLLKHIENFKDKIIFQCSLKDECSNGYFVAPTIISINSIKDLSQENFGPILHIIKYKSTNLEKIINEVNSTNYGLTSGIHSRIDKFTTKVAKKIHAGNIYINRNIVGAVVGVQPFGGYNLSGTGPKAGGPFYLYRLLKETNFPVVNSKLIHFNYLKLENFIKNLSKSNLNYLLNNELKEYISFVKDNSFINKEIVLPGPTGEKNYINFNNKGDILCIANNTLETIKQIICALINNNNVILIESDNNKELQKLAPEYIQTTKNIQEADISIAMIENVENEVILRTNLANREGIVIPIITKNNNGYYPLYLLCHEKSISINTTATGGNIDLISIVDKVE